MEGFGASGAWWHTWVQDFPEAEQARILDLLYSRSHGAGLSVFRYNIPSGSGDDVLQEDRRTVDLEVAPFKYDFDRDAEAIGYMTAARDRGVEHFVLFSNSPPGRMSRNGMTSGGDEGGSNLSPDRAADFARYLVDITEHLKDEYVLPHVTLSPINEPQWNWGKDWRGQEGTHYSPAEVAFTIRAVVDEVHRRGLEVMIEAPESGAWSGSEDYAKALFADPVVDQAITHFAIHSYWTNPKQRREVREWFDRYEPEKKLAMTEFCIMEHDHDLTMDSALRVADVIHDDLTTGRVVSWSWWLGVGMGGYKDGLVYAIPETGEVLVSKKLWVLGNYARHIRPGAIRIDARSGKELRTTAFLDRKERKLIVVAINRGEETQQAELSLKQRLRLTPEELLLTDADHDLQSQPLRGSTFSVPPRSVVTAIYRVR